MKTKAWGPSGSGPRAREPCGGAAYTPVSRPQETVRSAPITSGSSRRITKCEYNSLIGTLGGLCWLVPQYKMGFLDGFLDDLRYALRGLGKNRGFAGVAVLSLALGIGANATIFTLLNAIFLRPLPVRDAANLVAVNTTDPLIPGLLPCSYPNYQDYRDHNSVFSSLILYSGVTVNLTGRGDPQLLMGQVVSANYFTTLGVDPVLGRGFRSEDDLPGAAPVAVISHRLWLRLFDGNRDVARRTIEISGRSYSIIGVAPEGFAGVNQLNGADVFLPFSAYPRVYPLPGLVAQRRALLFPVVGRLKPGVSVRQGESALESLAQELEREYPRENQGRRVRLTTVSEAAVNARERP